MYMFFCGHGRMGTKEQIRDSDDVLGGRKCIINTYKNTQSQPWESYKNNQNSSSFLVIL